MFLILLFAKGSLVGVIKANQSTLDIQNSTNPKKITQNPINSVDFQYSIIKKSKIHLNFRVY